MQRQAFDERGLGHVGGRQDKTPTLRALHPDRDGKHPADRFHRAVERQLADGHDVAQPPRVDLLIHGQDGERERHIERGALFADVGGREIDDDFVRREKVAGRTDRRVDALLRLLYRTIGQADDMDADVRRRDADDLDAHDVCVDAAQRCGIADSEHGIAITARTQAVKLGRAADDRQGFTRPRTEPWDGGRKPPQGGKSRASGGTMSADSPHREERNDSTMLTRLTLVAVAALVLVSAGAPVQASELNNDQVAIRSVYVSFMDAQNAHSISRIQPLLWDSPKVVWLTVGGPIYGQTAILGRFKQLFLGTWSATVDYTKTDIIVHSSTSADVIAPLSITATTTTSGNPYTAKALVVTMFEKVGTDWKVAGIVPVAAAAQNY